MSSRTINIPVHMKRGGTMMCDAQAYMYRDSYGVPGSPTWEQCDDFTVFWPGGGEMPESMYDYEKTREEYFDRL